MKKCPKCGTINFDNMTLCENCFAHISEVESESTNVIDKIMLKEEKNEKFRQVFHIMLVVIYYAVYIPLFIICFKKSTHISLGILLLPAFFPLLYYLSVFKAEAMFKLSHMFHIDNIDDVRISDWYYFISKIGGYMVLLMGIVCMLTFLPHKPFDNRIVVKSSWSIFDDNAEVITDELTGQQVIVTHGETDGMPYDAILKDNDAIFLNDNIEGAKDVLETIYQNCLNGMFVPPKILVDGEKVYEFIFDGSNLKMCETSVVSDKLETTYHYNCKIKKNGQSYYISDFRTGLKLEFTF